jgi:hypothetical protein
MKDFVSVYKIFDPSRPDEEQLREFVDELYAKNPGMKLLPVIESENEWVEDLYRQIDKQLKALGFVAKK